VEIVPSEKLAFHGLSYSQFVVVRCLETVLHNAISIRGAARVVALFTGETPVHTTVRWWLLRLGYYKLTRPKAKGDWVWFADHSIQLGEQKVLMVVGVPLHQLPQKGQALTKRDLEPLALLPVTTSNGTVVNNQLQDLVQVTGVPRAIVTDQGSDLKAGISKFMTTYPSTVRIADIKHKGASVLKKQLNQTHAWSEFSSTSSRCRQRLQQTPMAKVAPPNQRSKSRYMNADKLTEWAQRQLRLQRKHTSTLVELGVVREDLIRELGWLRGYKEEIPDWAASVRIVQTATRKIAEDGYYRGITDSVSKALRGLSAGQTSRRVRKDMLTFVRAQEKKAGLRPHERLPGSTESLESTFGTLKYIEGDQASQGLTPLILAAPAALSETSTKVVGEALRNVTTATVTDWIGKYFNETLGSARRLLNAAVAKA